jgi:hypothetical protein
MMAKMASTIDVAVVQWRSYDTAAFFNPLGRLPAILVAIQTFQ